MGESAYSVLADYYDELMEDVDYHAFADFYEAQFSARCEKRPALVLDLGCGTGKLTSVLASRGYEMIGIDLSPEMLSRAAALAQEKGQNTLFLSQDMRSFDLYGTVDAAVCSLDCINYLTKKEDVARCFARVHTFLAPGGLFIFDVNTPWKFRNIFGNESYILENEKVYLGWQNWYTPGTGLCRFYLTFFRMRDDGLWERFEEEQKERAYSDRTLKTMLESTGFEVLAVTADTDGTPAKQTDERHFFICRRV